MRVAKKSKNRTTGLEMASAGITHFDPVETGAICHDGCAVAEIKRLRQVNEDLRNSRNSLVKSAGKVIMELQAERDALLALLQEARNALEYWTPDETVATAKRRLQALNSYYALRDRIDAARGKE